MPKQTTLTDPSKQGTPTSGTGPDHDLKIISNINLIQRSEIDSLVHEAGVHFGRTSTWRSNQLRWYKKRYGIRPAFVNHPWPRAANLHIPLVDKTIRRSKPNFMNLITVNPTVTFGARGTFLDQTTIRLIENDFHEMLHDHDRMDIFIPVSLAVDRMHQNGFGTLKCVQEFVPHPVDEHVEVRRLPKQVNEFIINPTTSAGDIMLTFAEQFGLDVEDRHDIEELIKLVKQFKAGQPILRFERIIDTAAHPTIVSRRPQDIICPIDTHRIEKARWIEDKMAFTPLEVEQRGETNQWDQTNVKLLLERHRGDAAQNDSDMETREEEFRQGVHGGTLRTIPISEFYHWFRWPGEKHFTKSVLLIDPKNTDLPLKFIKYNYVRIDGKIAEWPYRDIFFEITSERRLSPRGFPQMLDSLQTEITNNHNAKQNYNTIAQSLNFKVRRGSNARTEWIPGQPIYVSRMDDIEQLSIEAKDASFDNEEQILTRWAESYIGQLTSVLTSEQRLLEPRTKAEVDEISQAESQIFSLDVLVFQHCMLGVYKMVWERRMQYAPRVISLTRADGSVTDIETDIIKRIPLKPTGQVGNSNPQLRLAKARQRRTELTGNPFINQFELIEDALLLDDPRVAERLLKPPNAVVQSELERQILEIDFMNKGFTSVPKPADDDATHMAVIDEMLTNPEKRRTVNPRAVERIVNHRKAHVFQKDLKDRRQNRGQRELQLVAQIAKGEADVPPEVNRNQGQAQGA